MAGHGASEKASETKLRTETPTGYLDFALEIAAQWLEVNAAEALKGIVDPSDELVDAIEEAQSAVKRARMVLIQHSNRVYVKLRESSSPDTEGVNRG